MSINGIDSQIMVARTTDISKDTSILQRRSEVAQDFLAIQTKAADEIERQTVTKSEEAEQARLHADDKGGGSGGGGSGARRGGGDREAEDEQPRPGSMVPAEDHIIDIKI